MKERENTSVVMGTLLGDAHIQKFKLRPDSYTFSFEQENKEYAMWKAIQIGLPFTFQDRSRLDKRTNKQYDSRRIFIKMDKDLKKTYYGLFYLDKKVITREILNNIDNLSVAVWYMDDGNMYYNGNICHITLATNSFSKKENELIIKWFKKTYDITFKTIGKAIRITSKKECEKFMNIVEKYICPSMQYKTLKNSIIKYDKTLTDEQRKYRNNKYK